MSSRPPKLLSLSSFFRLPETSPIYQVRLLTFLSLILLTAASSLMTAAQTTFENPPFTVGSVNQNGWSNANACSNAYDHLIHANSGAPLIFGAQSLRISDAVTTGCFDGTYSASLPNEAGETAALNGGFSGGTRQNHFELQFGIASATPGAEQTGLSMSVAPDRGDGGRMSYLRFEDKPAGINVIFDEYIDAAPFGTTLGDSANGCGGTDDFTDEVIATLNRAVPHTIKFVIDFVEGPRNDVVKIYIDGVLTKTGTSWEDYFRYCAEQAAAGNQTKTVDSLGFFTRGTAHPANLGKGFLIDNVTSGTTSTILVDNDLAQCPTAAYTTIQAALTAANPGDTIKVCGGTYVEDVSISKANITLDGSGPGNTTISGALGGDSATVRIAASNVQVSNFTITRQGNTAATWNDPTLNSAGIAIQGTSVSGAVIHDNNITGNRSAIDINNSNGHTIRNNVIDNNHTGIIFRNQTDNMTVTENFITNNRTVGVLFLDGSGGTNSPVQSALNSKFNNNNISSNWYGQIVDRQTGGSVPAPGTTNLKNFKSNWYGTATPAVTTANSAEPGYAALIPVVYGGTATAPGGQPDIAGPASANFRYTPVLASGTDTNVETTPGRGTFGFQGLPATVIVDPTMSNGWSAVSQRTAAGSFVGGPGTPPAGFGSYHVTTGAGNSGPDLPQGGAGQGGKTWFSTQQYDGTLLGDITSLGYSTYVASSPGSSTVATSLQFQVDLDGNGTRDTAMVFEPVYSAATQGAVAQGVWQNWNARAGRWWFTSTTPGGTFCASNCFVPFSDIVAAYPNAKIITWYALTDGYGVQFQTGQNSPGNPWINYDGNIDRFVIGVSGPTTTFDFESTRPTVTINQASGQIDPTSTSPVNFTVTFSEAVTGFTASDVILSGSAGTTATTKIVTGGPTVYNVAVGGMTTSGPVIATVSDSAANNVMNVPSVASTSTDNSVTFYTCNNVKVFPVTTNVPRNTQFVVPITVDDTTGRGILAYDFNLTYNPAVMTPIAVETAGTLSSAFTITTNNTPGTITVGAQNTTALTGAGTLVNIRFISTSGIGTTSNVNFSSFMFNEGVPCTVTTNGMVNVISGAITGTVSYVNAVGPPSGPALPVNVPNTTLSAIGSVNKSAVSAANGTYSLSGLGSGAYTVTPSKTGNVNGISNLDSSKISQHVVNLITLNATQLIAADVSGNGQVTSFDAALVSQYIVHIANPGITGTWKFIPANRSYPNVETDQTAQDYSAILMGDVTGNWDPNLADQAIASPAVDGSATERKAGKEDGQTMDPNLAPEATINVAAPANQFAGSNTGFSVPLNVADTTGQGILGYQFDLIYNSNVLTAQPVPCDVSGTVSSSLSATCNPATPGLIKVSVSGTQPISGAGILLKLKFNAIGASGASSPLTIQNFMFNEGVPQSATFNGQVTITGPTAASASIKGRVLTPEMKGLTSAQVILTDSRGVSRTMITNEFGSFGFEQVEAGQTYVLEVKSKKYRFTPQPVSVTDNISELYLIGQK